MTTSMLQILRRSFAPTASSTPIPIASSVATNCALRCSRVLTQKTWPHFVRASITSSEIYSSKASVRLHVGPMKYRPSINAGATGRLKVIRQLTSFRISSLLALKLESIS